MRRQLLARVADSARLNLDWSDAIPREKRPGPSKWYWPSVYGETLTLMEFVRMLDDEEVVTILEPDRLRVVTAEEGLKYWRSWRATEQEKGEQRFVYL